MKANEQSPVLASATSIGVGWANVCHCIATRGHSQFSADFYSRYARPRIDGCSINFAGRQFAVVHRHHFGSANYGEYAPGHLFSEHESELAIAVFGHIGSYEWTAISDVQTIWQLLYSWEREVYDFWSASAETHLALTTLAGKFGLVPGIAE